MTDVNSQDQFKQHVQNVVDRVIQASPDQVQRGKDWYPQAHQDVIKLAQANPATPNDYMQGGKKLYTSRNSMDRAGGSVSALSPARPSGMSWKDNVPAAHQLRDVTDDQSAMINKSVVANQQRMQAQGALKKAVNTGVGVEDATHALGRAKEEFTNLSATARAPFKGTPLGHAGVNAIAKGIGIQRGDVPPLETLGGLKERHFAHDLLKPYTTQVTPEYHGMTGTVDEHMKNIMEGEGHADWNGKGASATPMPDVGKPGGYQYGRSVIHEAAKQTGLRPNALQPVAWVQEKESKKGGKK